MDLLLKFTNIKYIFHYWCTYRKGTGLDMFPETVKLLLLSFFCKEAGCRELSSI
jgi:hypothetical protein